MKSTIFSLASLSIAVILMLGSCKPSADESARSDVLIGEYIDGFTSGPVSRSAQVVIKFASEAVSPEKAGTTADPSIMKINPAIDGDASWADASTLVFTPSGKLDWDTEYTVSLRLDKVPGIDAQIKEHSFSLHTPAKDFTVEIAGLEMKDEDNTIYNLSGEISTSDEFESEEAEKIISAVQDGKQLDIEWEHNTAERSHSFVVGNIQRRDEQGSVTVSWNGKKAGVDNDGEKVVKVPSLKDFKLLSSRVISSPAQFVTIEFSDIINKSIELTGMVSIEGTGISKIEKDKNSLKIFPSNKLTGTHEVRVDGSLSNTFGYKLGETINIVVDFGGIKPAVRLPGEGVIVPSGDALIFPFEAVNLKAVDLRITQIFSNNIHSFLQNNELDGQWRLNYVGRVIERKKIDLSSDRMIDYGRWNYFTVDLSSFIDVQPGAIYRVEVGFRMSYSLFPCDETGKVDEYYYPVEEETDDGRTGYSSIYYGRYYDWRSRSEPCSQAYYGPDKFARRNILGSDFGMIAKRDAAKKMNIIVTNLKTAMPEGGVTVDVYDFQKQLLGSVQTDNDGFASLECPRNPFLLVAKKGDNTGYLKTGDGGSLSVSSFDVSGKKTREGLKGFIYGERGVWRPGDSVFVAFILEDRQSWIPEGHPITMEIRDARGQVAQRITRTRDERCIYPFYFVTGEDAPTGNWDATVRIGGTEFSRRLRIETVKPNRLKINLEFDSDLLRANRNYSAKLSSQWLHGTPASGMKARINATYSDISTTFEGYDDYTFDAPFGDNYYPENEIFEGNLDDSGESIVNYTFRPNSEVNNMLRATFVTRVFEPGGDFSINRFTAKVSPFDNYVGVKVPWSDEKYKKLHTEEDHEFGVQTLNSKGRPVAARNITVSVYKLEWRYWWSRSGENLASYAGRTYHKPLFRKSINTGSDGKGSFNLNVHKSRWGRYLVLVDLPSGNTAGKVVYFDWPYGRKQSAGGAEVLMVSTDKDVYNTGDKVTVSFPAGSSSRALVSLENGSTVLKQEWIDNISEESSYEFIAGSEMSPNVYVHVSLLNPYAETANDLPVRMYGIAPVMVEDPASHLEPVFEMPDKLRPEKEFRVKISEKEGRPMDYYFAIVDEGLLDLTGFRTPDPWPAFYSKEALGVKTWDMYRFVLGAYGGEMERLFAIGGDEAAMDPSKNKGRRFEPVVRVKGPYTLKKGRSAEHSIEMPQYVGSVRAMLIAANGKAYGNAEKTVPVSNPVMVLGTLPRVIGPGEKIKIPVSVFAMEEGIDRVKVEIETNDMLESAGVAAKVVEVDKPGEYNIAFDYSVAPRTGSASVNITASAGREKARHDINIEVRNPNPPETRTGFKQLEGGESWSGSIEAFGMEGSNSARLEVAGMLPLNLDSRLDYLIRYPHGCIEQTTSAVFPQLFIGDIIKDDPERVEETEMNIKDGIDGLRRYQLASGGMSFWPGSAYTSEWGSVYAAHFMVEAEKAGYSVPESMKSRLLKYITREARQYNYEVRKKYMQVTQGYRLFVLASAGEPLTGAMNRLRERAGGLDMTARWFLAGSYALSGRDEVAYELIDLRQTVPSSSYRRTYGSQERNMAVVLNVLTLLGENEEAFNLARKLSDAMVSGKWMSTQTTAWSLVALSNFTGTRDPDRMLEYSVSVNGVKENYSSENMINYYDLEFSDEGTIDYAIENAAEDRLYASLVWKGTPMEYNRESEERGIDLSVQYRGRDGNIVDPGEVLQGSDFKVIVSVRNNSLTDAEDLALTQIFPSGWEIMNTRMFPGASGEDNSSFDYRDIRDDRVYTYFNLASGKVKRFEININAAYEGEYILPAMACEGMYDNSFFALTKGRRVKVTRE